MSPSTCQGGHTHRVGDNASTFLKTCIYSRPTAARPLKESDSGTNISGLLHFSCRSRRCMDGAVTDTWPHCFAYSAAVGSIERDSKNWLQQAPAHSRNRVRKRRCVPLSRCAGHGLSRPDVVGIKGALLRFEHQATLSFTSNSVPTEGASIHEINSVGMHLFGD